MAAGTVDRSTVGVVYGSGGLPGTINRTTVGIVYDTAYQPTERKPRMMGLNT